MLDHKIVSPEERMQSQAVYGTGRLLRYNEQKMRGKKSASFKGQSNPSSERQTVQKNNPTLPENKIDEKQAIHKSEESDAKLDKKPKRKQKKKSC